MLALVREELCLRSGAELVIRVSQVSVIPIGLCASFVRLDCAGSSQVAPDEGLDSAHDLGDSFRKNEREYD